MNFFDFKRHRSGEADAVERVLARTERRPRLVFKSAHVQLAIRSKRQAIHARKKSLCQRPYCSLPLTAQAFKHDAHDNCVLKIAHNHLTFKWPEAVVRNLGDAAG